MGGRLDELVARHPVPDWRQPAAVAAALLAAGLVWASFARFDEVAIAPGVVVPHGQVKTVQHLEGGIVHQLLIREGDAVYAGDALVMLDTTRVGANAAALRAQLDGLEIRRARLVAESGGADPEYPAGPRARRPAVLAAERRSHADRQAELGSSLTVVREQTRQRALAVDETDALLGGLREGLRVAEERFALSASLLEEELTPRMKHLELESRLQELRSGVGQAEAGLAGARAALAEANEREREAVLSFRRRASEDLVETEVDIASRREMLVAANDQERRAVIVAPIDGFVQNMRHHTVGGVIQPGEPILDLVPADDNLRVEARVDPRDIGHIEEGMRATVKLSTYDFVRYGGLEGTVVHIAADANIDESGWHYFRATVRTDETTLGDERLPIIAGMLATVDIHTGRKRVLHYMVGPVLRMRHEAFRER